MENIEAKKPVKPKKPRKKRKQRESRYHRKCIVLHCGTHDKMELDFKIKFFRFPHNNLEKRELWIREVRKHHKLGDAYNPKYYDVICNNHFVTKDHSPSRNHVDYFPTIFPPEPEPCQDIQIDENNQEIDISEIQEEFENSDESDHDDQQEEFKFESLSRKKFEAICGISKEHFDFLYDYIKDDVVHNQKSKLVVLLLVIKQGMDFPAISAFFPEISSSEIEEWFDETLNCLVENSPIFWMTRSMIDSKLPSYFKEKYPKARALIDFAKVVIEMENDYRNIHALIFLFAIAPSGEIMFLSKAFGDKANKSEIVEQSGILDLIQREDQIFVSRDFPDLKDGKRIELLPNQPHVNDVIKRMKKFKVMNFMWKNLCKRADKILLAIGFLVSILPSE